MTYDRRGFGRSDKPHGGYDYDTLAEDLDRVVFAAAVPPFLMKSDDNPDGPLTEEAAEGMEEGLKNDRDGFFDEFTSQAASSS